MSKPFRGTHVALDAAEILQFAQEIALVQLKHGHTLVDAIEGVAVTAARALRLLQLSRHRRQPRILFGIGSSWMAAQALPPSPHPHYLTRA